MCSNVCRVLLVEVLNEDYDYKKTTYLICEQFYIRFKL